MKTSVVVIAHNEEEWIERCLSSLMKQTKTPDEIILLAHNCTDKTEEITRNYNVKIISYNGPKGIIYARLESLRHVTGDIILCTDGDSFVEKTGLKK